LREAQELYIIDVLRRSGRGGCHGGDEQRGQQFRHVISLEARVVLLLRFE
jgi:hypothetical protein